MYTVSPNTGVISSLLVEYESGRITLFYGNSASGKTTCCLLAALAAEKHKVIYVDTENGFNVKRLEQLYGKDVKKLLDNIFLIQPGSFEEQHETLLKLKKICENKKVKVVVVDTIGNYYRIYNKKDPKKATELLVDQMATLVRIARDLDKVVIVANQVVADLEGEADFKNVGGKPVYNLCKDAIELNLDTATRKRTAKLVKKKMDTENTTYYKLGEEVKFEIREKGLFIV